MRRKTKETIIIATTLIISACLSAFFSVRGVNNKRQEQYLDLFQTEVRVDLLSINIQIEMILSLDDKEYVKDLALSFEHLGTTISVFSPILTNGTLDGSPWRDFANFLLGWHDPLYRNLFQNCEGSPSLEEKELLESLYSLNVSLINEISSDATFTKNKGMNTDQIKDYIRQAGINLKATFYREPPII